MKKKITGNRGNPLAVGQFPQVKRENYKPFIAGLGLGSLKNFEMKNLRETIDFDSSKVFRAKKKKKYVKPLIRGASSLEE